jgi:hypothetical protein
MLKIGLNPMGLKLAIEKATREAGLNVPKSNLIYQG